MSAGIDRPDQKMGRMPYPAGSKLKKGLKKELSAKRRRRDRSFQKPETGEE